MTSKLLNQALQIAQRHYSKHPEFKYYLHYTFVIEDNQLVEWSTNKTGPPDIHFGYHRRAKLHSELRAYKKARGLLSGRFEIINLRLNRQGQIRLSAPCVVCREWLTAVGCESMWFSLNEEGWAKC